MSFPVRVRPFARESKERDFDAAVNIIHSALRSNPFESHILGGHSQLLPEILRAQLKASVLGGKVYVAWSSSSPKKEIVGVIACFGPGEELLGSERQSEARRDLATTMDKLEVLNPEVATWWKDYYMPRYSEMSSMIFGGPDFKRRGWHLSLLGVQPELQSRGIGSKLVQFVIDKARRGLDPLGKHLVVQTASEKAALFYTRMGFVERGQFTIECEKKVKKVFVMRCLSLELYDKRL